MGFFGNAFSNLQLVISNIGFTGDSKKECTPEEKERMEAWNLTALTYLHVDEWINLFNEVGYTGDYYWFIP